MANMPGIVGVRVNDPVLSNLIVAYRNDTSNFIARQVLKPIPVNQQTGQIFILDGMFGDPTTNLRRGHDGKYHKSRGFKSTTETYRCEDIGDHFLLDDQLRDPRTNQIPRDLRALHYAHIEDTVAIQEEKDAAKVIFDTSGNTFAVNNIPAEDRWDTEAGGDPIAVIEAEMQALKKEGRKANTVVMGENVSSTLRQHAIQDYFGADTDRTIMTEDEMKDWMSRKWGIPVERVFIGCAVANQNNPEQATVSNDYIWGNHMFIGYLDTGTTGIVVPDSGNGSGIAVKPTAAGLFSMDELIREEAPMFELRSLMGRVRHMTGYSAVGKRYGRVIADAVSG